ncbi:hypothetical protein, variant [Saprolegnia diclina VS20]|nr:hypothetical protein, variant [Saprolegnia diclina VS20]EQC35993.1 hypothetical protein, variant [Saprolegnia diclina VS20]|eukprot:XP_008610755.1 hypothetical protein, variant [Saprolegnia diclina VS20]
MEFLHLRPNDIIVHQGDVGETCFIVISGQVGIHVRSPDEQDAFARAGGRRDFLPDPLTCQQEQDAAHQAATRKPSFQVGARRQSNFVPPPPPRPVVTPESLARCGNKVTTLRSGATFGEICLIEPDSKRTATAIVDASCSMANLIVLSASSYAKMTRSQRTEGTISDHIAFLAQMHLFKTWSKMQLMRLASSLRFMVFAPQQYILRKNVDVEYFYMLLGGEAKEVSCVSFHEDITTGIAVKTAEHKVTAELTHLSKFDVAGEGLVLGKKVHLCPVDVKAESTVVALGLSKKLFGMYFLGGNASHRHVQHSAKILRQLYDARQHWREARVQQALTYPEYMVQITAKMMRLSGNICMQCGRRTHVAGDVLCLSETSQRHHPAVDHFGDKASNHIASLTDDENDDEAAAESSSEDGDTSRHDTRSLERHAVLKSYWKDAAKHGLTPRRPSTHSMPRVSSRRKPGPEMIAAVRASWPYQPFPSILTSTPH